MLYVLEFTITVLKILSFLKYCFTHDYGNISLCLSKKHFAFIFLTVRPSAVCFEPELGNTIKIFGK